MELRNSFVKAPAPEHHKPDVSPPHQATAVLTSSSGSSPVRVDGPVCKPPGLGEPHLAGPTSVHFPIAPSTLSNPPGAPRAPLETVTSATAHMSLVGKPRCRQVQGLLLLSQPDRLILSHKPCPGAELPSPLPTLIF